MDAFARYHVYIRDILEEWAPNRRGSGARTGRTRRFGGAPTIKPSIFSVADFFSCHKRRIRTALAHKRGQTRPQESGMLRNVTYRQDIRGDFVVFKTLTRRRNPVSQLVMPVGVQIFACPLSGFRSEHAPIFGDFGLFAVVFFGRAHR